MERSIRLISPEQTAANGGARVEQRAGGVFREAVVGNRARSIVTARINRGDGGSPRKTVSIRAAGGGASAWDAGGRGGAGRGTARRRRRANFRRATISADVNRIGSAGVSIYLAAGSVRNDPLSGITVR